VYGERGAGARHQERKNSSRQRAEVRWSMVPPLALRDYGALGTQMVVSGVIHGLPQMKRGRSHSESRQAYRCLILRGGAPPPQEEVHRAEQARAVTRLRAAS
jgi:hypothetical protein